MRSNNQQLLRSLKEFLWRYGGLLLFAGIILVACQDQTDEVVDLMPAVRVRILNGCGYKNAASEFGNYLTRYNIDVIGVGNANKFIYDRSIIVVKTDDEQDLERLMRYTGITRRVYALDNHSIESFQIIAGRDFREYIK